MNVEEPLIPDGFLLACQQIESCKTGWENFINFFFILSRATDPMKEFNQGLKGGKKQLL